MMCVLDDPFQAAVHQFRTAFSQVSCYLRNRIPVVRICEVWLKETRTDKILVYVPSATVLHKSIYLYPVHLHGLVTARG